MTTPTGNDALAQLLDRQQIADTLALICERIDAGELSEAVQYLTPDCITDFGPNAGGALPGRDLERIRTSQAQFAATHHQLGQVRISLDGDKATSVAYSTASHRRHDGSHLHSGLQYRDEWSKIEGEWKIVARRGFFAVIDGAPAGADLSAIQWVPRRMPPQSCIDTPE